MLENEERKFENGDNIEDRQEDIFAEEDVVVPEGLDAGQQSGMEGKPEREVNSGNPVNAEGQIDSENGAGSEKRMSSGIGADSQKQAGIQNGTYSENQMSNGNESEEKRYQEPNPYSYIPEDKAQRNTAQEKKHRKHINNYAKAICCAILCGVIVGGCIIGSFAIGKNVVQTSVPVTTNDAKLTTASATGSGNSVKTSKSGSGYTVSEIAKQCGSSVVAITNKAVSEVQTMFGVFQQESEGSGSGVIVSQTDSELLIVTNYHVISGSEELTVCFNDSEDAVFSAQIKGTDAANDLAVIAIQLSDISEDVLNSISIATIGDSDALEVGDEVVAIGNALGLGQSVTSGIVSALDREVTIDDTTSTLLQTDAAINPGNSGGALFNMNGELIGINSAKYASEEVEGMGFAIPMSTAQPIIESLMTKETRTKLESNYGCLNITGNSVSSEGQMYGIPEGVYVDSVLEGGAADNAGIQERDIITAIDGTTITSIDELKEELQYYAAGETVEFVIQRNGANGYESQTVTVTLDNASEQDTSAFENNSSGQSNQGNYDSEGSLDNGFTFR